jgi:hypothetical protein
VFTIPCVNLKETFFSIVLAMNTGNIVIIRHIVMDPLTHAILLFRPAGKLGRIKVTHCHRQVHMIAMMNGHAASSFVSILTSVETNGISDVGQTL